jgi:pimeloyl-ACP methyl ester carboxylesterase
MAIQYIQTPFRILDAISPRLSARLALKVFTTPRHWPIPESERAIARSAETIALSNGIVGMSWGRGAPVLLVHGWEGRVTQLGSFIEPLTARGFRVIGFNAPGHGGQWGKALNVIEYARFLRGAIAELGPLHGIIAHSMGASAVAFASQTPLPVERAVLISTIQSVGDVIGWFESLLALSAATREILRQRLEAEIFNTAIDNLDLGRRVPSNLPPALLLATDDDQDVPADATRRLAASWPRSDATVVANAGGHRKVLRDPRIVRTAVEFLTSTETAVTPPLRPYELDAANTSSWRKAS